MKQLDIKSYLMRGLAVVIGIFMVGIAVGFFKIVEMGADPFTAMNTGISKIGSCICVQKAIYWIWDNF